MTRTDVEPGRIKSPANRTTAVFQGTMQDQGFTVTRIDLRQYVERTDDKLGEYSLLTAVVETDRGTVELKYDEGFKGSDALDSAADFLRKYTGLASLVNRALIELQR